MGVLEAHGLNIEQINNYNSICTITGFSVAEYCKPINNTIEAFSHSHDEYEFIIPLKTIPLLIYDKANYIGEVGFVYPVNPYVKHGLEFPLNDSHCIDITISKNFLDEIKDSMGLKDKYFYTRFHISLSFLDLIRKYQEAFNDKAPDKIILFGLKRIITTKLIELGLSTGEDNRRPEKQYHKDIKNIIIYMYDHFHESDLNINKLANLSGYSLTYFTKAFKTYMADTPINHLNKLRISEAKSIMFKKQYNLSEIANMVGYANLSTFTEAFKHVTGMTPTKYKKEYIK